MDKKKQKKQKNKKTRTLRSEYQFASTELTNVRESQQVKKRVSRIGASNL